MRRLSLWSLLLMVWICAGTARAQVEIRWGMEHTRTVLMEPIIATVQIANYTGEPLDLSPGGNARLGFDVEDRPTSMVPTTGQPLIRDTVVIPSGESRELVVNLLSTYRILYGQSYMLTPFLEFDGMRFFGKRLSLEVQPGLELLKREYGLRSADNARSVSFRLIHRDRTDHLFFRVDNPVNGYCLGVYDLGPVIRFFTPSLQVDPKGVFHMLHQTAPDRFRYTSYDYDGRPVTLMYYSGQVGSIRLVRDEAGMVSVVGGTAYVEDQAHPGMLVAPALPPSHPYNMTLGEFPQKGRKRTEKERRGKKVN
jgi:hypothetical protein